MAFNISVPALGAWQKGFSTDGKLPIVRKAPNMCFTHGTNAAVRAPPRFDVGRLRGKISCASHHRPTTVATVAAVWDFAASSM